MLGKRGRLVRSRWVSPAGDTINSLNVLLSRQCLASDSIRRPARSKSPRRLILRRARGRMAWLTSENIGAGPKKHVRPCGRHINRWRQSTFPPTSGRTSHSCQLNQEAFARLVQMPRPGKKEAGPKGPASQTGRLHVWETWDHEDPEFQRDQPKPLVSKT